MDTIFENIFSSLVLLYSIGLIVFGFLYKFFPPKHISWIYGIQLKSAKRNPYTWQETHKYVPIPMMISGLLLTVLGIAPMLIKTGFLFTFEAAMGSIIGVSLILYILVDRHLKRISCESEIHNN